MRHSHNITRTLQERFGDPIGSYAGDAPVGVRSEEVEVCSCGMIPISGQCGCEESCAGCGMPASQCQCAGSDVCPACGMMVIGGKCDCTGGLMEAVGCSQCGMSETSCECAEGVEEVAPPGKEDMVKALKKDPDIDNPWAVAWSAHNKEKKKGKK